ncbi:MAG TPA: cation diffusion facilitator family transporter [Haliangium sp.]|nr:cation diffusion facilitator family transporter [Haliangium sp.]
MSFMVVEVVAGLISGSLALLSDAGHMLTDAGALALALVAQNLAARARTERRTFGYRRAEILAALINGTVLGASAVWIIIEAVRRFSDPGQIHGTPMLVVAGLGLVVNLISAWLLAHGHANINTRAAAAHVASDAAGSVAAMIAGGLVLGFGWHIADPIASIVISLLIFWGAWRLVRESVDVLMEGTPAGVDPNALEQVIRTAPGVASLHDLHVWCISDGFPVVTVHVVLDGSGHGTDVSRAVARRIQERFGIEHVTVQPEAPATKLVPVTALTRHRK